MLHTARVAGTANRYAPVQTRRSVGTALVRGRFGPGISWWMHPNGSPVATGTVVPAIQDYSDNNLSITQATVAKQPLKSAVSNVPGFAFDGVNDSMSTGATDLTTFQALTVVTTEYRANTTVGIELEFTSDSNAVATGCAVVANDSSVENWAVDFLGNVGYQIKVVTAAAAPRQTWGSWVAVMNKAQPAATELLVYKSGQQVTSFSSNVTSNNTNAFANSSWYIGGRNNTSVFLNGSLAQIIVITGGLSDSEASYLSLYAAQSAGIV